MPRAILTDIEGTTSSIAFVAETLFPYARERLPAFVAAHPDEVAPILAEVMAIEPGDPVATLLRWIDEDRKATPLKTLQGMIWADGYREGAFTGHIYADAAAALRRWHEAGIRLYVFSSGSVAAQKLLFGHSDAGDLTALLSGYFDTVTGPKREAPSYRAIAASIGFEPGDILFLSDTREEIAAAREAGMQALLIDRAGGAGDIANFGDIAA
ncbi:MAG: 2,3-diketo-5-methylthiopentyl-phosphate enolase-phosphatase [Sphingomonas bacterium]|uniref:acireductone synthase n=1 Tax=Sphingomonas bacterium TaxID=1895847 RepID=UPI002634A255|nr:acireductone synthase [Sphingomonas bacterium]MDB5707268.1 2,3-diketo-5-methylthiopentyl-phosphate enolase-phosphatase [Sphingomonas bacterium]